MNGASFHLNRVRRRLGETFQLRIDELTIRRGEVLALLGPTGAGKTTFMRLLTGLEYPDEGVIQLSGAPLNRASPLSLLRTITMVHQRPLLVNGSVEKNVAYGLRARRRTPDSKVKEVLKRLELGHLARRDARLLSGGQMQLVALARALVLEPEVVLLDEPTANLDPAYVALVEKVISEIQAEREMTVVWATHNLFQARRVSHWVTLLLDGGVIEVADNTAFFASPSDSRTAAFIQGRMVY
ncbi:MAG: ATP-binding cassette domain-containing protein [Pirellulales bacterium]